MSGYGEASDIIALRKHYYTNGINAKIDGKNLSKTGKELTGGLNEMLRKLADEYKSINNAQLGGKCRDASSALKSLARLYSS